MDQRERYRSTPPPRTVDDLPLAAYGGTGMEDEPAVAEDGPMDAVAAPAPTTAAPSPARPGAATTGPATPAPAPGPAPVASGESLPTADLPPARPPSPIDRLVHLLRTSRVAAGAGFAVVIIVGLVLLSGGGASPAATAATPTNGPTAAPTVAPPSGDASMTVSGAVTGTFMLTGLAGGQHVDATTVALGWGDALETTLSIAGPLDRGTRTTDEHLVLTIGTVINGQPVTFTSMAGECTIGMAQVGLKVQGSFTCHKLKGPDGKLTINAEGTYHS
jgi:hypothetical protein